MPYGDLPLDAPIKPNKGAEGGACNRQSCQAEPAMHYNHGSHAWYCGDCARDIGEDSLNRRDWNANWRPKCGHAMFETRQEIDAREAKKVASIDDRLREIVEPYFGWPRGREKPQSESLQRMLGKRKRRE